MVGNCRAGPHRLKIEHQRPGSFEAEERRLEDVLLISFVRPRDEIAAFRGRCPIALLVRCWQGLRLIALSHVHRRGSCPAGNGRVPIRLLALRLRRLYRRVLRGTACPGLFLHLDLQLAAFGEIHLPVGMEAAEGLQRERVCAGLVGAIQDVRSLALEAAVGGFQADHLAHA